MGIAEVVERALHGAPRFLVAPDALLALELRFHLAGKYFGFNDYLCALSILK